MNKPFYTFTIGEEDYRLCFTTASVVQLEEKLGKGLLVVLSDQDQMSKVSVQVALLHAALQKYHHGIKMADAYDLYDEILESGRGNGMSDLINALVEALKASGFIPPSEATQVEENPTAQKQSLKAKKN